MSCAEELMDGFRRVRCGRPATSVAADRKPRCGYHSDKAKARRAEKYRAREIAFGKELEREAARRELEKLWPRVLQHLVDVLSEMGVGQLADPLRELGEKAGYLVPAATPAGPATEKDRNDGGKDQ